ncbi:hypothetical protein HB364_25405 [Pseudoflavitalea sp. X16]|uniref:hypothetical protein n=1 Tax=Paraflavitalea devenefica TaxID=2716334 RepID=UPI0014226BF5|nr:hypothetical protein [Paraflavitalea devenefica]NII28445.1 hypothetical protein [Paraflavitalea devenefica]
MIRTILSFLFLSIFFASQAQTGNIGIGTSAPNVNASLELGAANKGLLLNRVALTAADNPAPLAAHVAGMVVYNTATAGTSPNNVSAGIYFNNGARWVRYEPTPTGLFVKSAGTQMINGAAAITDWAVTTNNFGSAWNGSVLTVPAGMQGWYSISAGFQTNVGGGGSFRTPFLHISIRINGADVAVGTTSVQVSGGVVAGDPPGSGSATTSIHYYLNAGDQVTIVGSHLTYSIPGSASVAISADPARTYLSILKQ